MIIKKTAFLFLIFFLLLSVHLLFAESDYLYGVELFRTGDYSSAALELGRFIFHNPQSMHIPYAHFLLGLAYANTNRYDRALFHLSEVDTAIQEFTTETDYSTLQCESSFHVLNILFRQKRIIDFRIHRESIQSLCPALDQRLEQYIESMSVALSIYTMEWEQALNELEVSTYIPRRIQQQVESDLEVQLSHRDKSPVLGGVLAIIPGFGHFYASRWGDGIRSLLVNAAFASLTYFAFKEDMPVLGGIVGSVSGLLYISNIYGGVNAVLQENARFRVEKRNSMLKAINVPPLNVITLRKELDL